MQMAKSKCKKNLLNLITLNMGGFIRTLWAHAQRMLLEIGQDAALWDVCLHAAANDVQLAFLLVKEDVDDDAHTCSRGTII